ncbi:radical SAM protein [Thalassobaculum sp.]|uniref:radical SAM protein n=1 Tax=Thalassobaculum sp. TaxID=2022740 RepID=UPI0032EB871F
MADQKVTAMSMAADTSVQARANARRRALRLLPAPEPSAGLAAYHRELELALAASPAKRANYDRYLAAGRRNAEPDYLPIKLDVENVSRCNFRCTMCSVSAWEHGRRAGDLPLAAFKRLIDDQVGLVEIKLQGLGEPLMQRDPYFDMIRYARARHIWVRTTTNASLLHLKDNYRKLLDADPNEIQVSVDGATKSVFETIRRGSVFERVVDNCRLINAYCRDRGVTRTKMWTVVQRANFHQVTDLVRLAGDLGFKHLTFSLELVDWGLTEWRSANDAVSVEDELDPVALRQLITLGDQHGVEVRFWSATEKYSIDTPESLCPWPFERAYVSSDLRVVPCCAIGNPDVHQIGDALDPADPNAFTRHWNGADYADFRRAHLEGRIPEICQSCYAGSGREL